MSERLGSPYHRVAIFLRETFALGIAAPETSVILPEMVPPTTWLRKTLIYRIEKYGIQKPPDRRDCSD
jgi:hypothetical protein